MAEDTLARSALYVPGDAPDKLRKALDRGADALIVDLEDAVAAGRQGRWRATSSPTWLDALPATDTRVWVRINPGAERELDVRAVAGCAGAHRPRGRQDRVGRRSWSSSTRCSPSWARTCGSSRCWRAPTRSCRARDIAAAPRVQRLQIGEADLRADVGVTAGPDERELLFARARSSSPRPRPGIAPPIAPVSAEFRDLDAFRASTEAAARLGFVGRACIHPAQVAVVNEVFTPSAEQVEKATALLARFDGADAVGVDDDGHFVDEAVLRQARLVLARAR